MPWCKLNYENDLKWHRSYLQNMCHSLGIWKEYSFYLDRIAHNHVRVFLIFHWFICLFHCSILLLLCDPIELIYMDVGFYLVSCLFVNFIMAINFTNLVSTYTWIPTVTSVCSTLIMAFTDMGLSYIHNVVNDWHIGTFYDTYLIMVIYMYLPIPHILPPLVLGIVISFCYILNFFSYRGSTYHYDMADSRELNRMFADVSSLVSLNLVGVFFRFKREIVVSSSFLDRHQYVMEEIWLRNARTKEQRFLHSILPPQIARPIQDDIRNRIKSSGKNSTLTILDYKDKVMAIQIHPDVTILYADIVNYTYLTTKLTVKQLVTMLHELYARFDVAAKHHDVLRIKFLGDCYYCVAGLTNPNPDHALSCAALGLRMIHEIREMRSERNMDIDIRVGVHSGSLFAGVIGATKLQFDIWGSDVIIANRLEATGMPGHIHISDRTLELMVGHSYEVLPGTEKAREDSYLLKKNIKTYLIPIKEEYEDEFSFRSISKISLLSIEPVQIEEELHNEFQKMPVGPPSIKKIILELFSWTADSAAANAPIKFASLHFDDSILEYDYLRQPDYLLRYSILISWLVGLSVVLIELDYNPRSETFFWVPYEMMFVLTVLLFITWYKNMCYWRYSLADQWYSPTSCWIFKISETMQKNLTVRVGIYMYILVSYIVLVSIVLSDCNLKEFEIMRIESKLFSYDSELNLCFHPWALTYMFCLIIGITAVFTRIPFMLKGVLAVLEVVSYLVVLFTQYGFIVHQSITTNPNLPAEYAHVILLFITIVSYYLMERQTEFNSKMNFLWKVELKKKQHDSSLTDKSITILLHNLLPAHVVNVYIPNLNKHDLYYEEFKMVSIMFASLKNVELNLSSLRFLNEVITEFDKILYYYREDFLVEKIKIVGCTYMAACGLDFGYNNHLSDRSRARESVIYEILRKHESKGDILKRANKIWEVAFVITSFALDLVRILKVCNSWYLGLRNMDRDMFNADISIGISSGHVMAGVVGASQVHYDIWGNAVNMASRMDSTGVTGKIQVTEETAKVLGESGIECEYRGMTFVKGRGLLPTYFVRIDDELNFIYANSATSNGSSTDKKGSSEV